MKACVLLVLTLPVCLASQFVCGQDAPKQAGRAFAENILKRQDANDDGVIQRDEAKNQLSKNFGRVDKNSDGTLSLAELTTLGKQLGRQTGVRQSANRFAVPAGVMLETDVVYRAGESEKWKLDIARPEAESDSPRPAIVFVHGGGWRSGDKGGGQWRSLPLSYAEKGYVCISVNYRLVGEAAFPACIEDCKNAVRWLRANAKKFNVDSERIGAYGNSAGAHLVAMLGLAGQDAGLEGDGPYQGFSSSVSAVVCSATPTNLANWDGESGFNERTGARLFKEEDSAKAVELAEKFSPITYVKATVPFLVVHGTADSTVPIYQGDSFAKALKEAGADVEYIRVDGAGHGVFGSAGEQTGPAMEKFFERTLRK